MGGQHRLLGQDPARTLGALVRLGEQGVEALRQQIDAAQ